MTELFLIAMLVFMIVSAVVAIFTDELLSAVIALGAVGFGSSIAFLLLGAPDLAITQIVVEVVALVLLIKVTIGVGLRLSSGRCRNVELAGYGFFILLIFILFIFSLQNFPPFGVPVMDRVMGAPSVFYIENGLNLTGAANLVTAVLLDFRAYDTLGEATVILTAVLGGLILLRKRGKSISCKDKEKKKI